MRNATSPAYLSAGEFESQLKGLLQKYNLYSQAAEGHGSAHDGTAVMEGSVGVSGALLLGSMCIVTVVVYGEISICYLYLFVIVCMFRSAGVSAGPSLECRPQQLEAGPHRIALPRLPVDHHQRPPATASRRELHFSKFFSIILLPQLVIDVRQCPGSLYIWRVQRPQPVDYG